MRGFLKPSLKRLRARAIAGASLLALALATPQFGVALHTTGSGAAFAAASSTQAAGAVLTPVSGGVTPLGAGVEVPTSYSGDEAVARAISQGEATPVAATAGDVDRDGFADLVVGYAFAGEGAIAVHRGNPDAVFPNSPEATARRESGEFTDAAFLPDARVYATPFAAEMVTVADVDADQRADVVVASRSASEALVLRGSPSGGLADVTAIELGGAATALASGDFGRRDGVADLAIGVDAGDSRSVQIFASPLGALGAQPVSIPLAAAASSLAFAQLGGGLGGDVAIAAGNDLLVAYGARSAFGDLAAGVSRRTLAAPVTSFDVMEQTTGALPSLAVLLADGSLLELSPDANGSDLAAWTETEVSSALGTGATRLVAANVTGGHASDVVVADATAKRLSVFASGPAAEKVSVDPVVYNVDAEPAVVVAMRLDNDALDDLVILRSGAGGPATVGAERRANFVVSSPADAGPNTLRQAIIDATTSPDPDTITFNLPTGNTTIVLSSALPVVPPATTIDGSTQTGYNGTPIVEVAGTNISGAANGFVLTGTSVIEALVINRFAGAGVVMQTGGNNVLIGNYIGTNVGGTADFGNASDGVVINNVPNNTIGGASAAARNVISGNNGNGISITGASATGNDILGNYIGTNAAGTGAIPNGAHGVLLGSGVQQTTIGGPSAAGNVISGNVGSGIVVGTPTTSDTLIQNNNIGVNADNSAAVPNANQGILIEGAGTSVTGNRIAFNGDAGIFVGTAGTSNTFSANSISNNGDLGIDLAPAGPTPNDAGDADTGANDLQNFPTLTGAESTATNTTITGVLNSKPSTQYVVQFFTNTACDPSGFGEGQTFLGQTVITTNATGTANINVVVNSPLNNALAVTATATDPLGNTSEFSQCVAIANDADLSVTATASPSTAVPIGQTITYTYVVTNDGPLPAENVFFFTQTPSGTTFVSQTQTAGTCTTPTPGTFGTIECDLGTIAPGGEVRIVMVVRVVGPADLTIVNSAFVTSSTGDPDLDNNSVTVTVNAITAPEITSITRLRVAGKPFRIKISGMNFKPGVQVFIGNSTQPWPNVKYKDSTMLVLKKGGALKALFPKNVPVTIRVVNPDGGEDTLTFTR